MRPFLVTELQAGKLPRLGLLLLCLLYTLPGFVGRDPWRHDDAADFGIALTMARGHAADWLMPNIAGEPIYDTGPLPFWIGAALARMLPMLTEHAAVRSATATGIVLMFVAVWYATYALVKRPGLMPNDPLGASASRIDLGRALADCALLVLLATLGVIAQVHETTADAAQLTIGAIFLFGAAIALELPLRGGLVAGAAIGASVMTRGFVPAATFLACACLVPLLSPPYRLVAPRWLPITLVTAAAVAAIWPAALALSGEAGREHLSLWLAWNLRQAAPLSIDGAMYLARTLPWSFWPAWPIAIWALLRWRGRLAEPAVALPIASLITMAVAAVVTTSSPERHLLGLALPLAMLAAVGLPTLARSVVSLIDWFAVMTYSLIGLVVWSYWIALVTGFPARMARVAALRAPGFEPTGIWLDITLCLLATAAWVLLVRWRVSRQPPMIWRAVVLSSAGLVFAWFLLMTLWLPAYNLRNTYREVSHQVAAALAPDYGCVTAVDLGRAERASLFYFDRIRFGASPQRCDWRLRQDKGPLARTTASDEPGWKLVFEGRRPRDDNEILRLYRRER